jgi:hypothetical protein
MAAGIIMVIEIVGQCLVNCPKLTGGTDARLSHEHNQTFDQFLEPNPPSKPHRRLALS